MERHLQFYMVLWVNKSTPKYREIELAIKDSISSKDGRYMAFDTSHLSNLAITISGEGQFDPNELAKDISQRYDICVEIEVTCEEEDYANKVTYDGGYEGLNQTYRYLEFMYTEALDLGIVSKIEELIHEENYTTIDELLDDIDYMSTNDTNYLVDYLNQYYKSINKAL